MARAAPAAEFDLIDLIASLGLDAGPGVHLGIGDDAALLAPTPGTELVVSTDTLVEGVHFPNDTPAEAVGHKALAVNLSDLAAMGARPRWTTLSLTLPGADMDWLRAFMRGFAALARKHGATLVGGDTTRGPLSITITVIGDVEAGTALRRSGAQPGDQIWVSGTPGDAAAGLRCLQEGLPLDPVRRELVGRLELPSPRLALGSSLRGLAHAAIDVSDGLLADLGHIARASSLEARLDAARMPVSDALLAYCPDAMERLALQLAGGDDYELCFTARESAHAQVLALGRELDLRLSCIGALHEGTGTRVFAGDGREITLDRTGFRHFEQGAE